MLVIWYSGGDSTSAIYAALIFTNFWLMFGSPEMALKEEICVQEILGAGSQKQHHKGSWGEGALGIDRWLSSVSLKQRHQLIRKGALKVG